jgi:hypothetical protein
MREDVTSVSPTWRLWCGWREVWVGTGVSLITYTSGNECRRVEKSSLAELEERAWGTAPMGAPRGAEARAAVPRASRCIRRVSRMERVVKDRGAGGRQEILRSPPAPSRVAAARDGVELSSSKKVGENFRGRVRRGPARAYRVAGSGDAGGGRAGALRRTGGALVHVFACDDRGGGAGFGSITERTVFYGGQCWFMGGTRWSTGRPGDASRDATRPQRTPRDRRIGSMRS